MLEATKPVCATHPVRIITPISKATHVKTPEEIANDQPTAEQIVKQEAPPGNTTGSYTGEISTNGWLPNGTILGEQYGDHYEIIEHINDGGMAEVYRVRTRSGEILAAKVMKKIPSQDEELFLTRFIREIKMLKMIHELKVKTNNVVSCKDAGITSDGRIFYLMECADYSLKDLIERNEIDPLTGIVLMSKVCTALEAVHKKGIIHRDLKPSNILICNGEPLISDFGVAGYASRNDDYKKLTASNATVGTVGYLSPEQARILLNGEKIELTGMSDRYSIAVIIYEILTQGELPVPDIGGGAAARLRRQIDNPPVDIRRHIKNIDESLGATVMAMLNRDANFRLPGRSLSQIANKTFSKVIERGKVTK